MQRFHSINEKTVSNLKRNLRSVISVAATQCIRFWISCSFSRLLSFDIQCFLLVYLGLGIFSSSLSSTLNSLNTHSTKNSRLVNDMLKVAIRSQRLDYKSCKKLMYELEQCLSFEIRNRSSIHHFVTELEVQTQ